MDREKPKITNSSFLCIGDEVSIDSDAFDSLPASGSMIGAEVNVKETPNGYALIFKPGGSKIYSLRMGVTLFEDKHHVRLHGVIRKHANMQQSFIMGIGFVKKIDEDSFVTTIQGDQIIFFVEKEKDGTAITA